LSTEFGHTKLLDGSAGKFDFQVGIMKDDVEDRITCDASANIPTNSKLVISGLDFTSKRGAQPALAKLDSAQQTVNGYRANLGAIQNRLVSTTANLGVATENLSAAKSRIRDADVAQATSELARNNILLQASTAALTQANAAPNLALQLLG